MRDFYEILGVDKNADLNEIKRAYRKQAKAYHPDLNPGNEEAEKKFKELTSAYEVLSDEDKRSIYDRYGEDGLKGNMGSGSYSGYGDIFEDLFDIFGGFGSSSRRYRNPNAPTRGTNIQVGLKISFKEAMQGTEKELKIQKDVVCKTCNGKKTENPDSVHTCLRCHGSGTINHVQNSILGQMVQTVICPDCNGTGEIIDEPCKNCNGTGREKVNKTIKVKIPKGVDNGSIINLAGEGNEGKNSGPAGDLLIYLEVEEDQVFRRQGQHLFMEMPISYSQAVLGDKINIPTINGIVEEKIPKGTQSGDILTIKGKGAPILRSNSYGNLYVTFNIHVPKNVSDEEERLLKELMKLQGKELEKSEKSIFEKIKDFFD